MTPRSRVLREKLTVFQVVKKLPAFYGTGKFITAFTRARHLSLFSAKSNQSMPRHTLPRRRILILSSHLLLGLPSGLFPSVFSIKILYTPLFSHIRAMCPTGLILLDLITRIIFCKEYKSGSSSLCSLFHSPVISFLLHICVYIHKCYLFPNIVF